jgi:predicted dehydrogenase
VEPFRWGILGTGFAARKFALGLRATGEAETALVASRSLQKAQAFAQACGIPSACGSYEEAVARGGIDAFYVATPPSLHHAHALLCLDAGKPVLVEKPFAVNADEARAIASAARARRAFCMEGLWTRFLPLITRLKRLVDDGALGAIGLLSGTFCSALPVARGNIRFDPALGGGVLLDRGVYLISLAHYLLGVPQAIASEASMGETGVDEQVAVLLRYDTGAIATLQASFRTEAANDLVIMGSRARVDVHPPVYRPFRMTLSPIRNSGGESRDRGWLEALKESHWAHAAYQRLSALLTLTRSRHARRVREPYAGNGYHYEALEVMRCVRAGKIESAVIPLAESVSVMETLDRIRAQWAATRRPEPERRDRAL